MKKEHKEEKLKNEEEIKQDSEEKKETPEQLDKRMTFYAKIILCIIAVLLIFLTFYLVNSYLGKHFTYGGLEFDRITKNNVKTYNTNFIIKSFFNGTYYIDNRSFYFRNDPRKIQLDIEPEEIRIKANHLVYISIDEPLPICKDNFIASYELGASLKIYGLDIKGAVTNSTGSQAEYPEITCANSTENTVIIISPGNFTGIEQAEENCYKLSYENCKILTVTEGFTLKLLKQAAEELKSS